MAGINYGDEKSLAEKTRRRGARLGILIALMAIVPGLVAGTAFISGAATSTLTGTGTPTSALQCGFDLGNTNSKDANVAIAGVTLISGTLYSAITVTINSYEVGASGYEYLDGEVDIACQNVAQPGTLAIWGTTTTTPTNLAWMYADAEASAASPFASTTLPSIDYCAPGGDTPAAFPTAFGGACATTPVQTACDALSPNVFLPNDKDTAAGNNFVYNVLSPGTALTGCGTNMGATQGTANTIESSLTQQAAETYYGIISFGIGGATASLTSATFTLNIAGTAT